MKPQRIDPPNCGCVGCITGYSKPITECSQKELKQLRKGKLQNASGMNVYVLYTIGD
jgi:hypothetical protein